MVESELGRIKREGLRDLSPRFHLEALDLNGNYLAPQPTPIFTTGGIPNSAPSLLGDAEESYILLDSFIYLGSVTKFFSDQVLTSFTCSIQVFLRVPALSTQILTALAIPLLSLLSITSPHPYILTVQ